MPRKQAKLYAAYGSNLNLRQMKFRCPGAKLYLTGSVPNYALEFRGMPDHAYATISPKEGASVPVAVWKLTAQDERNLDLYEGYPSHYFKEQVEVKADGKTVTAMAYRMNLQAEFGLPSAGYYQTVLEGYHHCGLDTQVLAQALKSSAQGFWDSQGGLDEQQGLEEQDLEEAEYEQGGMTL